jgi:hypothetical protein
MLAAAGEAQNQIAADLDLTSWTGKRNIIRISRMGAYARNWYAVRN